MKPNQLNTCISDKIIISGLGLDKPNQLFGLRKKSPRVLVQCLPSADTLTLTDLKPRPLINEEENIMDCNSIIIFLSFSIKLV